MAELRVISKFTVTVFEDGTYKTEKILLEGVNSRKMIQGKNEPSARIVQIIDILKEIKKMYEEYYSENKAEAAFSLIYPRAVKEVASKYNVTPSSVNDKMTRQCQMKKEDWLDIVKPFLECNDTSRLKEILPTKIVKGKEADLKHIRLFLEQMQ